MGNCEKCGAEIKPTGFECDHCDQLLCSSHRTPDAHDCVEDADDPSYSVVEPDSTIEDEDPADSTVDSALDEDLSGKSTYEESDVDRGETFAEVSWAQQDASSREMSNPTPAGYFFVWLIQSTLVGMLFLPVLLGGNNGTVSVLILLFVSLCSSYFLFRNVGHYIRDVVEYQTS